MTKNMMKYTGSAMISKDNIYRIFVRRTSRCHSM